MNIGRRETWVLLWSANLLSVLIFLPPVQGQENGQAPICTLSDSQTKKSIEAFSKIADFVTHENRCLGCHGRVNPYIDGTGSDPEDPNAPTSTFEHGPGKQFREHNTSPDGSGLIDIECTNACHSSMARRTRDGSRSNWTLAPSFFAFVNKDEPTICKQIKSFFPSAKKFISGLKDDEGGDNFVGTAFNGDRGLNKDAIKDYEVTIEKPRISHAALMRMGQDWVDAMGGEFKGDRGCGCESEHFAIQFSSTTNIDIQGFEHSSAIGPVKIPLTFEDDSSFKGDGSGSFEGGGVASGPGGQCNEQGSLSVQFHGSGRATETTSEHAMHLDLSFPMPMAMAVSAQCSDGDSTSDQATIPGVDVKLQLDLKGNVGETIDRAQTSTPGFVTKTHLEIIKLDEAAGP